jgi:hypothetical protein
MQVQDFAVPPLAGEQMALSSNMPKLSWQQENQCRK